MMERIKILPITGIKYKKVLEILEKKTRLRSVKKTKEKQAKKNYKEYSKDKSKNSCKIYIYMLDIST